MDDKDLADPTNPTRNEWEQSFADWYELVKRVRALREYAPYYLKSFYDGHGGFKVTAESTPTPRGTGLHITSTVFCALEVKEDEHLRDGLSKGADVIGRVARRLAGVTTVTTSNLAPDNIYTGAIYLAGFAELGEDHSWTSTQRRVLGAVLRHLESPDGIGGVGWQGWKRNGFLTYWTLRALRGAKAHTRRDLSVYVEGLEGWAEQEVYRQLVLYTSRASAFDCIQLGYALATCLAERYTCPLSRGAISQAFEAIFASQGADGMWATAFPIYPDPKIGTEFVFPPEMLAALFSQQYLEQWPDPVAGLFEGLDHLLHWIEVNRRQGPGWEKAGWVSNHMPIANPPRTSWSTVAVLALLRQVERLTQGTLRHAVLQVYGTAATLDPDDDEFLKDLVDSGAQPLGSSLRDVINDNVIKPRRDGAAADAKKMILLYGPPGTGKTTYPTAVARALGYPLITLRIGHFLQHGWSHVFAHAEEIFSHLIEADRVVALIDEVEELLRDREPAERQLESANRALTGDMLPLLQALSDEGRGIYFFTTNNSGVIDEAVRRRFDMILKVMPPNAIEKANYLDRVLSERGIDGTRISRRAIEAAKRKVTRMSDKVDPLPFAAFYRVVSSARRSAPGMTPRSLASFVEKELENAWQASARSIEKASRFLGDEFISEVR